MAQKSVWMAALWLGSGFTAEAAVRLVPQDYPRITDALAASADGDTISVAAGTYSPSTNGEVFPLLVASNVALCGSGMQISILDAEGSASVLELRAPAPRVTGFTLRGGRGAQAGGLFVAENTAPEVDHNLILENGAYNLASGALIGSGANPHVHHNVFWSNYDLEPPSGGDPHGLYFSGANGLVEHNLIGRGDSNGLHLNSSTVTIRNNIFYENGIPEVRGRGICAVNGAQPVIAHNLFHENSIAALLIAPGVGDVSGTQANDLSDTDGMYGNLDADPLFLDVEEMNWALSPGSPAIDAGDPASPRDPDGTLADVGPFYSPQSGAEDSVSRILTLSSAPNPFAGSTLFNVHVARRAHVRLAIFDITGREVITLRHGVEEPGTHAIRWNGRSASGPPVAPGVYFARLDLGNERVIRPILRVR
ncbi:MAG TPA: right-handed parallel beta-helix repeat-containing protein [Candidatus Eisenbacteria bacterium]|nr:right-handed parallel beta-helix repeat-containing protein [Candidatus Eisenbacteria bacterium]